MANVVKNFFGLYKIKNRIRRSFTRESGPLVVSRILCCAGKRSLLVANQLRPKQTCWPAPDLERPLKLAVSPGLNP